MSYGTDRTGHGRWTTIAGPSVGILWVTDDDENLGFFATGKADPTPVTTLISNAYEAGKPANIAFDELAAFGGPRIESGDVDTWLPDRGNISRGRRAAADTGATP